MKFRMKWIKKLLVWMVCFCFSMMSLLPILWSVLTSFKKYIETQIFPPKILPDQFSLHNYAELFKGSSSIVKPLLSSLEVAVITTVIVLLIAIPAAYSMSRFRTKRTHDIQMWVIGMRMAPAVAVLVPYYIIYSRIGLVNNKGGLIVIPLAMNSILIIAAFVFIFSWNELIYAMNLCGQQTQTLPVILSTYASDVSVQYQMMTATQVIQIIPVALITLLIQKNILTGLSFGAVKG